MFLKCITYMHHNKYVLILLKSLKSNIWHHNYSRDEKNHLRPHNCSDSLKRNLCTHQFGLFIYFRYVIVILAISCICIPFQDMDLKYMLKWDSYRATDCLWHKHNHMNLKHFCLSWGILVLKSIESALNWVFSRGVYPNTWKCELVLTECNTQ